VGDDDPPWCSQGGGGGLHHGQASELGLVNQLVAAGWDGQQVRVLGDHQAADEVQASGGQVVLVGGRVVAGVEDHGQILNAASEFLVAGRQLIDDGGELGDVGTVARVSARDHRHAAVAGDHQRQPSQPQVMTFLLGPAALGDRGPGIAGIDEGGEVGHIQHQGRQVQGEPLRHCPAEPAFNLGQPRRRDGIHGVPEPAVIQRHRRNLDPPVRRRGRPPIGEGQLRARRHNPVERGQRQIGTHRRSRIGPPRAHHLVDDPDHAQPLQHRPHRRHIPERQVPRPLRGHRGALHRRRDVLRLAQVALRDDRRLAANPGDFAQVVVRLPADPLADQA
jgi:hypothetical protein